MRTETEWQHGRIEALRDLSPTVREFSLRPLGGTVPWTVGSHLRVQLSIDGREALRSYSLVGLPSDSRATGVYRIAVKRVNPSRGGSRHMWRLGVGAEVMLAGPDNHFVLPLQAPFTLLVAGGIGITPMLGMALTLAARAAPVRMLYAARTPTELIYAERLRSALGDRLATFTDSEGQRIDLQSELAALPQDAQMLVCGPAPLLQAAQQAWTQAARPAAALRFETFGSGGLKGAEPFWVQVAGLGARRIEVPADRSLLQVLAEHGVEAMADCERGECGLCALDVLSLEGEIDHRDVFLSPEQKAANQRLCACVSRVRGGGVRVDTGYRRDPL
ncbi:MAG: PDR/VanB family oxidoreductase [Rubrivivax sp.]|nr:PDR/VanB family oxidoreductase [Rubrivivax sp.]MDH5338513.1 PDR/VanB family oxidoreductase [Rubrivivax sp.]